MHSNNNSNNNDSNSTELTELKSNAPQYQAESYLFPEDYFLCPISQEILDDPVITPEGITYSKKSILTWLQKEKKCPLTKQPLTASDLIVNHWAALLIATAHRIKDHKNRVLLLIDLKMLYQNGETFFINPIVNSQGRTVESSSKTPASDRYQHLFAKNLIDDLRAFLLEPSLSKKSHQPEEKVVAVDIQEQQVQNAVVEPEGGEENRQEGQGEIALNVIPLQQPLINNAEEFEDQIEGLVIEHRHQPYYPQNNGRLNEARQYYRDHDRNYFCVRLICLALLGGAGTGIYFIFKHFQSANNSQIEQDISYSFEVPYSSGGKLCLNNPRSQEVSVNNLQFVTNANIVAAPWGDLFPWDATLEKTLQAARQNYIYNINWGKTRVKVGSESTVCLTYNAANALGPLNKVFMNPEKVILNSAALAIKDACTSCADPTQNYQVGGWYTNWAMYGRNFPAKNIPVSILNHISYAFIGFNGQGNVFSTDEYSDSLQLPDIALLRQKYNYLKTSITFGGYCSGAQFNEVVGNDVTLTTFVNNAIAARKQAQADGIIVNWEWWGDASCSVAPYAPGLVKLLAQLKANDPQGIHQFTAPGAPNVIQQLSSATWCSIAANTNRILVETIDYNGAFSNIANYASPLRADPRDPTRVNQFNAVDGVNTLLNMGCIAPQQLSIFVPAYGRAMNVTQFGDTHGVWQPVSGAPQGQFEAGGVYDYRCIQLKDCHGGRTLPEDMVLVATSQNPQGNVTQEPWGYTEKNRFVITYDDAEAAGMKADYVRNNNLTGIMMWDLSGDAPVNSGVSLGASIQKVLSKPSNYGAETVAKQNGIVNTKSILNSLQTATTQSVWSKIMKPIVGAYHYLSEKISTHAPQVVNELQTQMPRLLFNASVATAAALVANATAPGATNYTTPLLGR